MLFILAHETQFSIGETFQFTEAAADYVLIIARKQCSERSGTLASCDCASKNTMRWCRLGFRSFDCRKGSRRETNELEGKEGRKKGRMCQERTTRRGKFGLVNEENLICSPARRPSLPASSEHSVIEHPLHGDLIDVHFAVLPPLALVFINGVTCSQSLDFSADEMLLAKNAIRAQTALLHCRCSSPSWGKSFAEHVTKVMFAERYLGRNSAALDISRHVSRLILVASDDILFP